MYSEQTFKRSVALLRIAIGIVFFWFGALKLAGFNPVYDIVYASFHSLLTELAIYFLEDLRP